MLSLTQLQRYADVLLWAFELARPAGAEARGIVFLQYDLLGLSITELLYERLVAAGFTPVVRSTPTPAMERAFHHASDERLDFLPPGEVELFASLCGGIGIQAPSSLDHLADIPPDRVVRAMMAKKPLWDIIQGRAARGLLGWTLAELPTQALADRARMTLAEYEQQMAAACFLEERDPVRRWTQIREEMLAISEWLNGLVVESLDVQSDGVNLRLKLGDRRRWVGLSGHNLPSFEIFTSPDWRHTVGTYYADLPSFINGRHVDGLRLEFTRGEATVLAVTEGEDHARQMIAADPGACRLGEFSLTDKRLSPINRPMANTLYDENFGGNWGNCHIALGACLPATFDGRPDELTSDTKAALGFNDSAVHWDLVNTQDKLVTARLSSGVERVIYEHGSFAL